MSLWTRLIGTDGPKLPAHQFAGALGDVIRGERTPADLVLTFGLDAAEQADAQALVGKMREPPEFYALGGYQLLSSLGTTFDLGQVAKGLGFIGVDVEGISEISWKVRYNKVGTGVLTLQLWNETDAAEVVAVTDSVVGDNKESTPTARPAQPLTGGVKLFRVRAMNSTAGQSPAIYGSCLQVKRRRRSTALEVHEILCLAEAGLWYGTEALLKERLGVA